MRRIATRAGRLALLTTMMTLASASLASAQTPPTDPPTTPGTPPATPGTPPATPGTPPATPGTPPATPGATPAAASDIRVQLRSNRGNTVVEGQKVSFTSQIRNVGAGAAQNVRVIVDTPEEFDLDDTNQDGDCTSNEDEDGRMLCTYPTLQAGGVINLRFRGKFFDRDPSGNSDFDRERTRVRVVVLSNASDSATANQRIDIDDQD